MKSATELDTLNFLQTFFDKFLVVKSKKACNISCNYIDFSTKKYIFFTQNYQKLFGNRGIQLSSWQEAL